MPAMHNIKIIEEDALWMIHLAMSHDFPASTKLRIFLRPTTTKYVKIEVNKLYRKIKAVHQRTEYYWDEKLYRRVVYCNRCLSHIEYTRLNMSRRQTNSELFAVHQYSPDIPCYVNNNKKRITISFTLN